MKKEYALQNLKEAKENLETIMKMLKNSRNLEPLRNGYLEAYFLETYWHINQTWNCRNMPQEDIDDLHGEDYDRVCRFPKDIEIQ